MLCYSDVIVWNKLEIHGATSETFKKFIRRLATEVSDANDIPYCIALSYWQRRMSTTLQRMNATIFRSTQVKISRRLGMMREVDLDPISIVILIIPLLNLKI